MKRATAKTEPRKPRMIRMSDEEWAEAERKAKADRRSISGYIRKLVALAPVLALLFAASPARALDPWTWQDVAWEAGFAGLVAVDIQQTKWMLRTNWGEESNPIYGKHPNNAKLNTVMIGVPLAHAAISALLPAGNWRRGWQCLTFGVEAHTVYRSFSIGVKFKL